MEVTFSKLVTRARRNPFSLAPVDAPVRPCNAVSRDTGVAKAIQFRGTVHDLAEAELCYAPQFGAAKDPVNLAGMLAENVLNGDMPVADWLEIDRTEALLVDVREPDEFAGGRIPNAINLPPSQMRDRYAELPTHREIWTCCGVGQRAYFATRFLMQHGHRSRHLSGV